MHLDAVLLLVGAEAHPLEQLGRMQLINHCYNSISQQCQYQSYSSQNYSMRFLSYLLGRA